jgi:hypothetical protein
MAGLRSERSPEKTLWVALVLASTACSFDAGGLGQSGETGGSQSTGTSSSTTGETAPTTSTGATTAGPAGEASATGETGSTGPVDPVTSTTTPDPTTGTTADPTMTTSTTDATTTDETTSGCVEKTYYKDEDMDGFGKTDQTMEACAAPDGYVEKPGDCADKEAAVNPSVEETCNQIDDDCDDHTDEYNPPVNAECDDCKMALYQPNNRVYYFCDFAKKWPDAKTECEKREGFLATDIDEAHHDWLLDQIPDNTEAWFLGGTSPDKNEMFEWIDGSPVPNPDPRWGVGRPGGGGGTNRLSLISRDNLGVYFPAFNGKWYDRGENEAEPFICESEFFP